MSEQWQPIETAPRDGTQILGFAEWEGIIVCNWLDCSEIWEQSPKYAWAKNYDTVDMSYETFDPTHWMPLPLPPILRHNGVGEADLYSDEELHADLYPDKDTTTNPTTTMPLDEDERRYTAPPDNQPDDPRYNNREILYYLESWIPGYPSDTYRIDEICEILKTAASEIRNEDHGIQAII